MLPDLPGTPFDLPEEPDIADVVYELSIDGKSWALIASIGRAIPVSLQRGTHIGSISRDHFSLAIRQEIEAQDYALVPMSDFQEHYRRHMKDFWVFDPPPPRAWKTRNG